LRPDQRRLAVSGGRYDRQRPPLGPERPSRNDRSDHRAGRRGSTSQPVPDADFYANGNPYPYGPTDGYTDTESIRYSHQYGHHHADADRLADPYRHSNLTAYSKRHQQPHRDRLRYADHERYTQRLLDGDGEPNGDRYFDADSDTQCRPECLA
jgi:hypothetical protein